MKAANNSNALVCVPFNWKFNFMEINHHILNWRTLCLLIETVCNRYSYFTRWPCNLQYNLRCLWKLNWKIPIPCNIWYVLFHSHSHHMKSYVCCWHPVCCTSGQIDFCMQYHHDSRKTWCYMGTTTESYWKDSTRFNHWSWHNNGIAVQFL